MVLSSCGIDDQTGNRMLDPTFFSYQSFFFCVGRSVMLKIYRPWPNLQVVKCRKVNDLKVRTRTSLARSWSFLIPGIADRPMS